MSRQARRAACALAAMDMSPSERGAIKSTLFKFKFCCVPFNKSSLPLLLRVTSH